MTSEINRSSDLGSAKADHDALVAWPAERPMKLSSQQEADCALAIWQSNRDDQARMDGMLREFFSDVREKEREEEFKRQMSCVLVEFPCVISTSEFSSPPSAASSSGA